MIPLSIPTIQGNEWEYIKDCLDNGWVSSVGEFVDLFEKKISEYTRSKYSIACVNGTAALQVSLRLIGVLPGDEVIVPTITFIAPINAVSYNGGAPIFMDADRYYTIDAEKTLDFIKNETVFKNGFSYNKSTGKCIKAIISVHVFGNAANLGELLPLCEERNIVLMEDAAESVGTKYKTGKYKGKHTGTIGSFGCLSFNGNKIITTGGGGMILTDNPGFAGRLKYLTTQAKDDGVRYIHNDIGYNFRLPNIQAAMGVAQLEKLPLFLKKKNETYKKYKEEIDRIPGLQVVSAPEYAENNYWMIPVQINKEIYGKSREELIAHLTRHGIQSRPVWHLNHLQKPYKKCQEYKIKRAYELVEKSICIPGSVNITEDQINYVIETLSNG